MASIRDTLVSLLGKQPNQGGLNATNTVTPSFSMDTPVEQLLSRWQQQDRPLQRTMRGEQITNQDVAKDINIALKDSTKNPANFLGTTKVIGGIESLLGKKTAQELAHATAQKNAAEMLGLHPENTAMERAKALGFNVDKPLYHGTKANITELLPSKGGEFGPGIYTTPNPNLAHYFSNIAKGESENIIPLITNANEVLVTSNKNIPRGLGLKGLEKKGYNSVEGIGSTGEIQRTILNPANIRSRFAAFDPKLTGAAAIAAGTASTDLLADEDKQRLIELLKNK